MVTYLSPDLFYGPDYFTFSATDGQLVSTTPGTVSITVTRVDHAPVATGDTYNVLSGTSTIITVEASDVDNPITDLFLQSINVTGEGTASIVVSPPRSFRYTAPVLTGTLQTAHDYISAVISDGQLPSTPAIIDIYVTKTQSPPPKLQDLAFYGSENTPMINNLAGGVASSSAPIAKFILSGVPGSSIGAITDTDGNSFPSGQVSSANGTFEFTPALYYYGTTSFSYKAVDENNGVSNLATVTIFIAHVNQPPVAYNASIVKNEGESWTYQLQATDVETTVLTFSYQDSTQLKQQKADLSSSGLFSFTPQQYFYGSLSFTYIVTDLVGATSNVATVSITINHVNQPPVVNPFSFQTPENTPLSAIVFGTDVDTTNLTYSALSQPLRGSVVMQPSGAFTYTPNSGFYGTDTFYFQISDYILTAQTTVTVTVTQVFTPPVALPFNFSVNEGSQYCGQLVANDNQTVSSKLQYYLSQTNVAQHAALCYAAVNGQFCYTPQSNFYGSDQFAFYAVDPELLSSQEAAIYVTVLQVFQAPAVSNIYLTLDEGQSISSTLSGTEYNGLPLTFTLSRAPGFGTITFQNSTSTTQSFTYTPNYLFYGIDLAYYTVSDGIFQVTASIFIKVNHVDHAPIAYNVNITATESQSTQGSFNATDIDGNTLVYEIVSQGTFGSAYVTGSSQFVYLFTTQASSPHDILTYRAFDGQLYSNIANITVTLINVPANQTNVSADNAASSNIVGTAVGVSIGILVAIVLAFFVYRKYQAYTEYQSHLQNLKLQENFQSNPLYETLTHEMYNPLFEKREVKETFAPGEF